VLLLQFGSYRLGVHVHGADIDTVDRDVNFFCALGKILVKMGADLQSMPRAWRAHRPQHTDG
jgi:poly(A) polymerase Pap1